MTYIEVIKTAIFIFPFIALLFTIPFILHQYHKYGSINKLRVFIIYSFILYMLTMYFLVILPLPSVEEVINMPDRIPQLQLFNFINDILRDTNFNIHDFSTYIPTLTHPSVYTAVFNIIMTIPLGMYLRYYYKCGFFKNLFISFLISLFFEITQLTGLYFIYPKAYRLFDVDDLLTNTLGGVIGFLIMGIVDNFLPTREEIDAKTIEEGKVVSGLRRITLFFLDTIIYSFLTGVVTIIGNKSYLPLIMFIIYFGVIPYLWQGKTIGSNFLNVRIEFPNLRFLRSLFRPLFNYLYYFIIPVFILVLSYIVISYFKFIDSSIMILLLSLIIVLIYYLINIILILKNKRIYYDSIFKTKFVSTITEKIN